MGSKGVGAIVGNEITEMLELEAKVRRKDDAPMSACLARR